MPEMQAGSREEALQAEIADLKRQLDGRRAQDEDPLYHAKRPSSRGLLLLAVLAVIVIAGALALGFLPRSKRVSAIAAEAKGEEQELPVVLVTPAKRAVGVSELSLPANIQALTEAPVLARADGYLKRRLVDIGDKVKAGQLLAEIEAPELDQQVQQGRANVEQLRAAIEQAKAAVEQGQANRELARVTADRWSALLTKGAVSRQENDQYQAQYKAQAANVNALQQARSVAESNLSAAEANLQRLQQLQSYKQVRAPFSGVITLRNVDTGALISTGQTLLFRVAQVDTLRAYLNIPQSDAQSIRNGESAKVTLAQYPGRVFQGTLVRSASALDPSSRTMLAELRLPNREGLLLPGMYADVLLSHTQSHPALLAPGDTLLVNSKGTQIATVDAQNKVRIKNVVLGRDFGREFEVLQGISDGELLIANPNDRVRDGVKVKAERDKPQPPAKPVPGSR